MSKTHEDSNYKLALDGLLCKVYLLVFYVGKWFVYVEHVLKLSRMFFVAEVLVLMLRKRKWKKGDQFRVKICWKLGEGEDLIM